MKTAVSIPDELFEQAEQLARSRNISRSELYADALRQLVADDDEITANLNDVYGDQEQRIDPAIEDQGLRVLRNVEW